MTKTLSLKDKLIEFLREHKVSEQKIEHAFALQKQKGGHLADILVSESMISQQDLLIFMSEKLSAPLLNLSKLKFTADHSHLLPERLARSHLMVPVSKIGDTLTVAMADPLDVTAVDDLKNLSHSSIEVVMANEKDIREALEKIYIHEEDLKLSEESPQELESIEMIEQHEHFDIGEVAEESQQVPIIRIVDLILSEALKKRASDIHLEPYEDRLRVRYRIDGALREAITLPKKNQNAIIARLKIMSRLDITENRIPQDGRFKIKTQDKEVDFRVSILPLTHGGKVVLRALDKSNLSIGLDRLGFFPDSLKDFKEAIAKPFGMILITGPTGSGKSTTLYSILNQLNTPERNIITIEEPVEYQVEGITQISVNTEIGLTFANGLRSILRQSPDVVMVGEIRDSETADIAIKASLTGQMVLSTLHTNDAPGVVTRLIDMGVEPFLITSSLILSVAQRLCRRVCPNCKQKCDIPQKVLDPLMSVLDKLVPDERERKFLRGKGCDKCNHTGYLGRMGTIETMVMTDEIREMVLKKASSFEIRQKAIKQGMVALKEDAIRKFATGATTLEEVFRITGDVDE